jgi:phosphate transport system protein
MPEAARRHTHRDFEGELSALNEALLAMAGRVEQMIGLAVRALFERDGAALEHVRNLDRLVNDAEIEIDGMCLRILARRQPMGSDLRLLTRVPKMVTDIERAGDLAVNLAKQAHGLAQIGRRDIGVNPAIERMAAVVRAMLADALDAFVERNPEQARDVIARDDEVDRLQAQVCTEMVERMTAQPDALGVGLHVLESARFLERIGDHATNLAEQVVFLVQAQDIRHPL